MTCWQKLSAWCPFFYKTDILNVSHLRSIQKLEELNVGMENLGDEVKSLTQQCNGNGNTAAVEDNNNPPTATEPSQSRGGEVLSSTPQRTVGGRLVPPPDESPVVSQRYQVTSLLYFGVL